MGRRKIEIQPITHERNRSVTFLKRRNGLFKKAYELGVLCSVDVAVIIFEERPGHEMKLHQYSSSDVRTIVQRQIKYQGEKDIKGPSDFSGVSISKFEDGEQDGEDDDNVDADVDADADVDVDGEGENDDEVIPSTTGRGARGAAKRKRAGSDMDPTDSAYHPKSRRRPAQKNTQSLPHVSPPPSMRSSGLGTLLAAASEHERESHPRSVKRSRSTMDSMHPGRRSPGRDMVMMGGRAPAPQELYLPDQSGPGRFGNGRDIRGMPQQSYGYQHHGAEQMHSHQHHPSQAQQGFNPSYTPMFPISSPSGGGSPPPSFIPLHSHSHGHDNFVSRHPGASSSFVRDMTGPGGYGGAPPPISLSNSNSRGRFNDGPLPPSHSPYDHYSGHNMHPGNMIRQQQSPLGPLPPAPYQPGAPIHSPIHSGRDDSQGQRGERDMFGAFLEADERLRSGQIGNGTRNLRRGSAVSGGSGLGPGPNGRGGSALGGPKVRGGLDWPTHDNSLPRPRSAGDRTERGPGPAPGLIPQDSMSPNNPDPSAPDSWFDLFSGTNTSTTTAPAGGRSPPIRQGASGITSWDITPREDLGTIFVAPATSDGSVHVPTVAGRKSSSSNSNPSSASNGLIKKGGEKREGATKSPRRQEDITVPPPPLESVRDQNKEDGGSVDKQEPEASG